MIPALEPKIFHVRRDELPFVRRTEQPKDESSDPVESFVASTPNGTSSPRTPSETPPAETSTLVPDPSPPKSNAAEALPGVEVVEGANGVLTTLEEPHDEHGHGHIHHGKVHVGLGGSLAGKHVEHAVKHVEHAAGYAGHAETLSAASEIGADGSMTASEATEALADARHVFRDSIVEKHPELSLDGAEHADKAGWLEWAAPAATVASAILAPVLLSMGVKEYREGVKHNDLDRKLEGAGAITVGVRSGISALVTGKASMKVLGLSKWLPDLGPVAGPIVGTATKFALKGLGVAHGAIDVALGVRNIRRGKITKGVLETALGVSLMAASVGAIGVAAPVVLLVAKIGHTVIENKLEARKARAEQAALAEQQKLSQAPEVGDGSGQSAPALNSLRTEAPLKPTEDG